LEKKGYTYVVENDGVYFDISKFKDYGKLSGQSLENLKTGKRVKKKKNNDFVLWKFSKKGEPSWKSPWGDGRPGWHIECSAMSYSILGLPLDIHGGGQDLIFPHHEDEIAQSEAGYGKKFANYWMHNGMVNVNKVKMSKSFGNFKTIKDLLEKYSGEVIRYFVISTQYRKPIDFSNKTLENAKNSYERLKNICADLDDDKKIRSEQCSGIVRPSVVKRNKNYLEEFESAMNDDLNTPNALQVLWKLVRDENALGKYKTIKKIDEVFGLKLLEKEKVKIPLEIKKMIKEREIARREKDWGKADELRDEIKRKGFVLEDGEKGVEVKKL